MKNFIFKSTAADLQKMFQSIETKLDTMNKNIVYCTYKLDWLYKHSGDWLTDNKLQKQVDDYFEDDAEDKAEQVPGE